MKNVLLFTFLILTKFLSSQTFKLIPDKSFASCLRNYYVPSAMKGDSLDISSTLVTTSTRTIIARDQTLPPGKDGGIKNLEGIQYFKSLVKLDCSYNFSLASLPDLPTKLRVLNCNAAALKTLPYLPGSLKRLSASYNSLSAIPALPDSLNYLDVGFNHLARLPRLPEPLALLDCSSNSITVLPNFPKSLQIIRCDRNLISCFPLFPDSLLAISCSWNELRYLPPLPSKLQELYCVGNMISCFPEFPQTIVAPYDVRLPTDTVETLWYSIRIEDNHASCLPNYVQHAMRPQELEMALCNQSQCSLIGKETTCGADLILYPNPTEGKFKVQLDKSISFTIELFDLNGHLMLSLTGNKSLSVDASNLIGGFYSVNISTGEGVFKKKLIILK